MKAEENNPVARDISLERSGAEKPGSAQKQDNNSPESPDPGMRKPSRVAPLYKHAADVREEEARLIERNLLVQFDVAMTFVDRAIQPAASPNDFELTVTTLNELNRCAIAGLNDRAGVPRRSPIFIKNTPHIPPDWQKVDELVQEMCDYVNSHWKTATPIHLAAYVLWRLNWIHPFCEGNGRTARMASYLLLCVRLGFRLPGVKMIPEQIATDRPPYYVGLDAADSAWKKGAVDVSALERLLEGLLARQLLAVHEEATRKASS